METTDHSNAVRPDSSNVAVESVTPGLSWRVVTLCALVCLFDGFDMVVAPVSLPSLSTAWGMTPQSFSGVLTVGVMGMGLGAAFIAPLGDRFGRRPLIIACCVIIALSSLLIPLSTTIAELTAFRFLTGLGMGASLANALALVSEYSVTHFRSRIISCVYAMSALGGAIGGFVAPEILARWGWQGTYVVGGILPVLLLPFLIFGLAESRQFLQAKAESRASPTRLQDQKSKGVMNSFVMLLAPTYRIDTLLLWALFFLAMFTTYMISSWLPTLMHLAGWSVENSARAIMAFSFGGVLGGFVLGWLVDRGKVQAAIFLGFGLTAIALVALRLLPDSIALWMTMIVMIGAGTIGVSYALVAVAAIVYPTELRAGGIGAGGAMGRLGASAAPLIGGGLLALNFSATTIMTGLVVPTLIALGIAVIFRSRFSPDAASQIRASC